MKKRMTPKLYARASLKDGHDAFLKTHWDWLRSHRFIAPLLNAYEKQEITAEACVFATREALLTHEIRVQIAAAQESIKKSLSRADKAHYTITIYCKWWNENDQKWDIKIGTIETKRIVEDADGKPQTFIDEEELIFTSELFQQAQRIACLRLARREDGMFAEIVNNFGTPITTTIKRDDALAIIFPKDKHPFMKRMPNPENKPFKNFQRAFNTRVSFSRG